MESTKEKLKKIRKTKHKLIGNNIQFYMKQNGIIAEELADICGMCPTFVSRVLNNHRMCVSLPTALRIGKALKTPVEKLFIF